MTNQESTANDSPEPTHGRDLSTESSNEGLIHGVSNQNTYFQNDFSCTPSFPSPLLAASPMDQSITGDPREAYPTLKLSGRMISAAFTIPYSVAFAPGEAWDLQPRRGNSAIYGSFSHLASPASHWNHTLLGWTGEIQRTSSSYPTSPSSGQTHFQLYRARQKYEQEDVVIKLEDRKRLERQLECDDRGKIVPVWLTDEADESNETHTVKDQSKWRKFAEKELYSLFHYKQSAPEEGPAMSQAWADYCRLNKLFADRLLEIYIPGDVIMIHDYSLMLLPSLLRQRLPHVYIGFYLHIPFPSSEYVRCIGRRKELLEGVLGANMIAFQSPSYTRHFSSSCTRLLGLESSSAEIWADGARVAIGAFPAGIDITSIERAAFDNSTVTEKLARIREMYVGTRVIIGRDRLDSVRGVAQKLRAFELFLERFPEWQGKVVLIQITSPSEINTDGIQGESKSFDTISELASKINGVYGSLSFTPVRHFPQYLPRDDYFALLRVADAALITSVRDGMNTTSLEYVVCQQDNHSPLILSEFSGTAAHLTSALHVNPWDLGGVAEAINHALCMSPEERKSRSAELYQHVAQNNVQSWSNRFTDGLLTCLEVSGRSPFTPVLDRVALETQYRRSSKRLFLFDYDGTLTPIVQDPATAIPTDHLLQTLTTLAADEKNAVWVISGRDQAFLDKWLGHISALGLSAEHGCFLRRPHGRTWVNIAADTDMKWRKQVSDIFLRYTKSTPGSFLETKKIALTWHYRRAERELGAKLAVDCERELKSTVASSYDVDILTGKMNLEVRPRFVNKGVIAHSLIAAYGTADGDRPEFVMCLGDDTTDEDMFRSLLQSNLPSQHLFSVTIGPSWKPTLATWHLLEPADVIDVLSLHRYSFNGGEAIFANTLPEGP